MAFLALLLWIPVVTSFKVLCPECEWHVNILDIEGEDIERVSYIENVNETKEHINDIVKKFDWNIDVDSDQPDYVPYKYLIMLSLVDVILKRRVIQNGIKVEVSLFFGANNPKHGSFQFRIPAILTDLPMFKEEQDCETEYCDLVWVAPLPMSLDFVIEGSILSTGVSDIIPNGRFIVGTSTFGHLIASDSYEFDVQAALAKKGLIHLHFILGLSTSKVIPLLDDENKHVILVSQDDFMAWSTIKLPDSLFEEKTTSECSCMDTYFDAASTSHRMLFQLKSGIYELNEEKGSGLVKQLDICTKSLQLPAHHSSFHQHVLVEGACENEGKIYVAVLDSARESPENFTELTDKQGRHVCEAVPDVERCTIISTAVSSREKGSALVLVKVATNSSDNSTEHYLLVEIFFIRDQEWIILKKISKWVSLGTFESTDFRPKLMPQWVHDEAEDQNKVELKLKGIEITPWLSPNIVLWGNMILRSSDFAATFYVFPVVLNVTMLKISLAGTILALTETGCLYCTSTFTTSLQKIYPSSSWDFVHSLENNVQLSFSNIISIFENRFGESSMLLLRNGNLQSYRIPIQDILILRAAQQALHAETSLSLRRNEDPVVGLEFCPYQDIDIVIKRSDAMNSVREYTMTKPFLSHESKVHKNTTALLMGALIRDYQTWTGMYHNNPYRFYSPCKRWIDRYEYNEDYILYLFQNGMQNEGIHVDFHDFKCDADRNEITMKVLPKIFYLDHGDFLSFEIWMYQNQKYGFKTHNKRDLYTMDLSTMISDFDLVAIQTQRTDYVEMHASVFAITVSDQGSVRGQWNKPGYNLHPMALSISAWNAPLNCFNRISSTQTAEVGIYTTDIKIGCPPNLRIMFDWNASWHRSDTRALREQPFDCLYPDPNLPCFYFHNGFYPVFTILDESQDEFFTYEGNFTLKIIGGSPDSTDIDKIKLFSEEEVFNYNNMESSVPAKIWGPMVEPEEHDGWPIFNKEAALSWICQPQSPCAHIFPTFPDNPDYFFMVEFSNKHVDDSTYCDFTFVFVVHLFGLPIDPLRTGLVVIMSTFGILCLFAFVYFIFNNKENEHTRKLYHLWRGIRKRKVGPDQTGLTPQQELALWREQLLPLLQGRRESGEDAEHKSKGYHNRSKDYTCNLNSDSLAFPSTHSSLASAGSQRDWTPFLTSADLDGDGQGKKQDRAKQKEQERATEIEEQETVIDMEKQEMALEKEEQGVSQEEEQESTKQNKENRPIATDASEAQGVTDEKSIHFNRAALSVSRRSIETPNIKPRKSSKSLTLDTRYNTASVSCKQESNSKTPIDSLFQNKSTSAVKCRGGVSCNFGWDEGEDQTQGTHLLGDLPPIPTHKLYYRGTQSTPELVSESSSSIMFSSTSKEQKTITNLFD